MGSYSDILREVGELLASGDAETAAASCRQALNRLPDDEKLSILLAVSEARLGHEEAARARLQRLLSVHGQSAEIRFELGRLLAAKGDMDESRKQLKACLAIDPGHAPAWTILARLDRFRGDREKAISGLKTALRADDHHVPALVSLAELMLEKGDTEAANEYASSAIQIRPDDAMAQLALARVFVSGGLYEFAERCLSNAIGLAPESSHVLNTAGYLYQKIGHDRRAAQAFASARRLGIDDSQNLSAFATSLARMGRTEEARQVLRDIPLDQVQGELIRDLSEVAFQTNDVDTLKELNDLARRHQALPEDFQLWTQALLMQLNGQHADSLLQFEQLIDSSDPELNVRSRMHAGQLMMEMNQPSRVVSLLEPLIGSKQLSPVAHWEIAKQLHRSGNDELAIKALRATLERPGLDQDSAAQTRSRLVDLLDRHGRFPEAAELLAQSAWRPPYLGGHGYLDLDDSQRRQLLSLLVTPTPTVAMAHAPRIIFVAGWPCTGRDLVIAALANNKSITALPQSDWSRRMSELHLPIDVQALGEFDDSGLHRMRRRYLRGFSNQPRLLEPTVVQSIDLVHLARLFPDSLLINPVADPRYLKLQWRLLGYRQVPAMFDAWQKEQQMIDEIRERLSMRIIDCQLEMLIVDSEAGMDAICRELEISFNAQMNRAVELAFDQGLYRAPDHWKNYDTGS